MRKYSGYICGVCSTIGKFLGISPWILRIIAICFFNKVITTYVILGVLFAVFLDDNENVKKETKKKIKKENLKLEEGQTDFITSDTFKEKTFSERKNGNLLKN